MSEQLEPIAPVEAKEKERCEFCQLFAPLHSSTCFHWVAEPKPTPSTDIGCEGCGEPVYLTRGYGYSHVDTTLNVSCDARPKSNHPSVPKPTPSTPAPDLVERIAAYVESESECLMPIVVEETKRAYGVRLLKVMADEIREKFNPQPDSSSISSEPEQIVSDKVIEQYAFDYAGDKLINQLARELQQWRKWNAAKGSK